MTYFNFGKYRGESVQQADTNYLVWALANLSRINPSLRAEIEAELANRLGGRETAPEVVVDQRLRERVQKFCHEMIEARDSFEVCRLVGALAKAVGLNWDYMVQEAIDRDYRAYLIRERQSGSL